MNKNDNHCHGTGFPQWKYEVVSEDAYNADSGKFRTYGIQLIRLNHEKTLHDVSTDRNIVDWMTELFNHHQLSPLHLIDAVVDLLP